MPIHKNPDGTWQWGKSGKKYKNKEDAVKQMKAIFANGYVEKKASSLLQVLAGNQLTDLQAKRVLALVIKLHRDHNKYLKQAPVTDTYKNKLLKFIKSPDTQLILDKMKKPKAVGLLMQHSSDPSLSVWLSSLYVLPSMRGKKIGSNIINKALLIASLLGYDKLKLGYYTANPASRLYLRLGYKPKLIIALKQLKKKAALSLINQKRLKAANLLFKYGSYSLCLTKVAQQKNTKKSISPKMHSKLTWQPQLDVTRLNLYNNINLFLNALGDTLTQHRNIGIKGRGKYRRGSAYHIQQQALDDINNMLTLPLYKKRIKAGEILPKYTLDLIHNNGDYAKQAALLYINGRVMPKVRAKFNDKSLTLDRALRNPRMRLSVYFYYTFGSDPGNRRQVAKRLGHFNSMYDLLSRRMQHLYNLNSRNAAPMTLYSRKFAKDKGGRYFMYTLRPNQSIMKLGRNANHTLKILKDNGFSGFKDPRLNRLPMGYKFKYYVDDNYNDYY